MLVFYYYLSIQNQCQGAVLKKLFKLQQTLYKLKIFFICDFENILNMPACILNFIGLLF